MDSKDEEQLIQKAIEESEDPSWVTDPKEKIPEKTEDYEIEVWLSTDGKHTIRTLVKRHERAREAIAKACTLYDYVVGRYGTKQAQAVKEYARPSLVVQKEIKDNCSHPQTVKAQSHSPKNPNRWFSKCTNCKAFLGWLS